MKRILFLTAFVFTMLLTPSMVLAQPMMGTQSGISSDGHTAREEAEGKAVWEKLQVKEVSCDTLSNEDFGALGEYFMGQMMGDSHEAMNNRLIQMMGKDGEKQMHISTGKRMSNCEPNAPMPESEARGSWMSMMMGMMGSAGSPQVGGGGNSMMGSFGTNPMGTFGWGFGWIFMILFWGLVILGIVALIKWIAGQGKGQAQDKSAFPPKADPPRAEDILKERYAKGEIEKKEFEEKKKDIRLNKY